MTTATTTAPALADSCQIGRRDVALSDVARPLRVDEELGLAVHESLAGKLVHTARWPDRGLYECRATKTPGGEYLLMFPDGGHYGGHTGKVNDMLAYRSSDRGRTWRGPTVAFDIHYNQHGFIPLIPRGSERIYAFGTQPVPGTWTRERGLQENAPVGFRYSDDDGHHWSEVRLIRPGNDPSFTGMSVMRMCETGNGTWLLGSHEGDWSYKPLMTRQYVLRSEDQGATWELLPGARHGGWCVLEYNRMDEGRPISLGGERAYMMIRTPEGHLWHSVTEDDGRTWSDPAPTPLVHPCAPPMLFHLSDGTTLCALHHNRHTPAPYVGLTGDMPGQKDRAEIWVSLSHDGGATWSEPRFMFCNALAPTRDNAWRDYNCSYCDMFADEGVLNIFVPHRWERVLHLQMDESDLGNLPRREDLAW